MFYFEESFNKSIKLWKHEYFAEKGGLRDVLWTEYRRIEDIIFEQEHFNDWDKCMPWVIYKVLASQDLKTNKLNIGEIKVMIFEKQFRDNFTEDNFNFDFCKEYKGFRKMSLSAVSLDEYMSFFEMEYRRED